MVFEILTVLIPAWCHCDLAIFIFNWRKEKIKLVIIDKTFNATQKYLLPPRQVDSLRYRSVNASRPWCKISLLSQTNCQTSDLKTSYLKIVNLLWKFLETNMMLPQVSHVGEGLVTRWASQCMFTGSLSMHDKLSMVVMTTTLISHPHLTPHPLLDLLPFTVGSQ